MSGRFFSPSFELVNFRELITQIILLLGFFFLIHYKVLITVVQQLFSYMYIYILIHTFPLFFGFFKCAVSIYNSNIFSIKKVEGGKKNHAQQMVLK